MSLNQESISLILNGAGLFILVLTMYFMSKTMELYGGRVGKSLNYVGLGIFFLSIVEILTFVKNIFEYDIVFELLQNDILTNVLYASLKIVVFAFFAYGFFEMSKVIEADKK